MKAAKAYAPAAKRRCGFCFHVVVDDAPACGVRAGGLRQVIDRATVVDVGVRQGGRRCHRRGCREWWPQ